MIHSFINRFFEVVFSIEVNLIRTDNAAQDSNLIYKNINFWEAFWEYQIFLQDHFFCWSMYDTLNKKKSNLSSLLFKIY